MTERRAVVRDRRRRPRVVVTAGPTREHVDPVRYLSNESSGRMGFEIAAAAAARGWRVVLVAGPVHLATPAGVRRVDVVSARDMLAATRAAFADADALFMAAAVADWRPARRRRGKWRKEGIDGDSVALELVKNPDVLATLARAKGTRRVVGFALETGPRGEERARAKLRRKGADYVVLNDASVLNAERTRVTIFGRDESVRRLAGTKRQVARALVALVEGPAPAAPEAAPPAGRRRPRG